MLPEREYHVSVAATSPPARVVNYFLDIAVFCMLRNLDIECDGDSWHALKDTIRTDNERDNLLQANLWHVPRFNTVQIKTDLAGTLRIIREVSNRYGRVLDPGDVVRRFDLDGRLGPGQATPDF